LPVNRITWSQVGGVTDPGRYMFTFGWLTITAEDLAVWKAYPNATFTLLRTLTLSDEAAEEKLPGEEFRLGTFDLLENKSPSEQ
jgi:hypothetical protein